MTGFHRASKKHKFLMRNGQKKLGILLHGQRAVYTQKLVFRWEINKSMKVANFSNANVVLKKEAAL